MKLDNVVLEKKELWIDYVHTPKGYEVPKDIIKSSAADENCSNLTYCVYDMNLHFSQNSKSHLKKLYPPRTDFSPLKHRNFQVPPRFREPKSTNPPSHYSGGGG